MSDVSDEENDFTEEQTEYTEGGEENDDAMRKNVGEENEDEEESESGEENEGEENEDEDGSEGGEENEENDSTNDDAEDGEAAVTSGDIDIEVDGNTKEVVKKLTMKEKFNDMERKKILIISLIFSLMVSLPSGLGIGLGTAPVPDYCSYPKFKPCRDHGKCVTVSGFPTCECNVGWKGELCNMPSCDNEDACIAENSVRDKCSFQLDRGVICHCKEGFTGRKCEDKTPVPVVPDYCSYPKYKSCRDHGKCVTVNGLPTCECNAEWAGELCNMPSCDNDDACIAENSVHDKCSFQLDRGVTCHCKKGFTGRKCEDKTDLCHEYNDCNSHGTCSMLDGMPKCACDPGWTGLTCAGRSCTTESGEDYCDVEGSQSCDDSSGHAICECKSGYNGVKCDYYINNNFGK